MLSFYSVEELEQWTQARSVQVKIRRLHALRYVYIRVFAPYGKNRLVEAYHSLRAWLAARKTDIRDVVFIGMSLDDPSVTPSENCRYDMGVAFPAERGGLLEEIVRSRGATDVVIAPADESECGPPGFSIRDFAPQEIAAIHCIGDLDDMARAWQYLYRIWFASAGFEPADLPAMELFVRLPEEIGWQTFDLQACIPVVRL